ncbi:lipid A deacylase LpxR family protein [Reichenbachiella ulvae]|uniref:Lipid A deacylase LpxR family protein n=1 Tax=Reichenbachiella ulvae TaxID=2980104 RepID=A0ABT3CQH9_9BACT|nr:lipid A deacylase LpxR family protein [Reichenbachiella ulvae]MCV9385725.1 lipid A deacylase LpxR family protein [Reichenbachiella ulvae]
MLQFYNRFGTLLKHFGPLLRLHLKELRYLLLVLLLVSSKLANAQDSLTYQRALFFQFDNDLLFFDAGDRYYTNGLFFGYRQQTKQDGKLNNLFRFDSMEKSTWELSLISKIFNPYDLKGVVADEIDRPYAGLIYANVLYNSIWDSFVWSLGADMGWLGPKTGIGNIQYNLHRTIGWVHPRGWDNYQINDTPILQFISSVNKEWFYSPGIAISSKLGAKFGSIENQLVFNSSLRMGRCLSLGNSTLSNSSIGRITSDERKYKEIFFVYQPEVKRVFYDATIDGNLIGTPSDFVRESREWVFRHSLGLMLSTNRTDFHAQWSFLTREVEGGKRHKYGTLILTHRF